VIGFLSELESSPVVIVTQNGIMYARCGYQVWNYAKSPERGVSQCVMYLDDVEIFRGEIRAASFEVMASGVVPDMAQSIVFSEDPNVLAR
jgi:hypothetical protein